MNILDLELPLGLDGKFRALKSKLKEYNSVALAFSGGVDSAFLMAAAKAADVGRILAVTVVSAFFTQKEVERAKKMATLLDIEHICLEMDILASPEVVRNDVRRCYYCKHHSFSMIKKAAVEYGVKTLVHGINTDDLGDYRPGIEAANALGFQAPLVSVGFSKSEIRSCSKAIGLEVWDLPSQSCLATRIPIGEEIQQSALDMVERGENLLHDMGFAQVRVRCHHRLARIEILPSDFIKLLEAGIREEICNLMIDIGFSFVALDLGGYETGKMNIDESSGG